MLFSVPAFGQVPDKPQPRVADREFWIEAGAMGAAWTADTWSTHDWMQDSPYHYEVGGFFNGTRDTWKPSLAWGAVNIGSAILGYEWKKRVHNRYLHPLWRVPMLWRIGAHTQAAIHNWRE